MKKLLGIGLGLCTITLVACGGGSSSSSDSTTSSSTTPSTTQNGAITATCAVANAAGVNTYSVTTQGCILNLKAGSQTGVCTSSSLKMLSGTGLTAAKVQEQGASFSAKGLTINGEAIKCI